MDEYNELIQKIIEVRALRVKAREEADAYSAMHRNANRHVRTLADEEEALRNRLDTLIRVAAGDPPTEEEMG